MNTTTVNKVRVNIVGNYVGGSKNIKKDLLPSGNYWMWDKNTHISFNDGTLLTF